MRNEIAILVPSLTGKKSDEWQASLAANALGLSIRCYEVVGRGILEARNRLAMLAYNDGCKWFFWLDDDVIIPPDAIRTLLSHDNPYVSGVVTNKASVPRAAFGQYDPAGLHHIGRQEWKWPGGLYNTDVVGLACCLIRRDVFEAIPAPNWFNWEYPTPLFSGQRLAIQHKGEDIHLCNEARKAGFRIYVDPNVHCQHVDYETGKSYPSEKYWLEHRRK